VSDSNGFLLVLLANAALGESILTRCSKAREVAPRHNTGLGAGGAELLQVRRGSSVTNVKRRRDGRSTKLSATVKEAVADATVEISHEEAAQARARAPRSRTRQDSRPEQPLVGQWPTDLRTRDSRVVAWYCSEPRLAFNRTVVLRYRIQLEQRGYAPATINLRLAAVRRIAYEAADAGLLSPELAAGIRRVKGVRRIGVRLGNWLTPEQGRRLLDATTPSNPRELRD
jgi:hypothetical protein